ncbi:lytic transglycosylase domain-containing protein [Rubellimicrobium rubrum]|uniref:Lytic transglycosylase domain-containing protein n=1 Tax=Rubellimicrobium rubrum TaxID=2585369 RepID=A0A5C4MQ70_9RHOB|nr:lytic transglycosylase domain-containing protein [Rubellimicrobium rubrum]TNC47725.1 lytic transglycosylase domain-containing protein [Rubellimicrobium rubrum]
MIEEAAEAEELDAVFFARLLWRESLFDASAVSHAGAQGIAQFMPGTARLRGLQDPFNPAEAILASADYLKNLEREFGNLGMAAVAYNAGEQRAARFLAGETGIPRETRAYVAAITGHSGEKWRKAVRDDSPALALDLALDPSAPFREACLQKAVVRDFPSFAPAAEPEPELLPWGVILAAQGSRETAERQVASLAGLIPGERIDHVRMRVPGSAQRRHVAQVGRETREAAEALCGQIRAGGAACIVLRN